MKHTLRIPTDQYAYVEVEVEGTPEEAKGKYDEIKRAFSGDTSMSEHTFLEWIMAIVNSDFEVWGDVNAYNELSAERKMVIQSLKRYYKRNCE